MTNKIRHTLVRVGIGLVAAAFLIAVMFLAGCTSGTKDIARAAGNTQVLAANIVSHADALAPLVADNPQATGHVKAISQSARDIGIEASKVQNALPKVEDKTPWWATLIGNLLWIGLAIGAAVLAVKFWPVIAGVVGVVSWLGWLIPKPQRLAAERDVELYYAKPAPQREAERDRIAAIRMDPYYNAAWVRAERKKKLGAKA